MEQSVEASGVTPGGSVALFGVSQGHNGFIRYYLRHDEVLVDEDGDGSVRWEPELLPSNSVFAAVDVATGEVGLGSPEGFEPPPPASPAAALAAGGTELNERGRWVYALWVRPGAPGEAGVWGANFGDGGATDADGAEDGAIRAPLSAFGPRGSSSPPPDGLAAGDAVVVIDPQTLVVAATRVAG